LIQRSDSGCPSTQLAAIFMRLESNGTSTQHSESGFPLIRPACLLHGTGPKQLLLLFMHRSVLLVSRSESYGATSTQRSESEYLSTQLATSSWWFESNGASVQHSDPELPLIRPVGLESGLWPSRPAEPWSRVVTQAWISAADIAVFANVSSASLGRRTFSLPC